MMDDNDKLDDNDKKMLWGIALMVIGFLKLLNGFV